MHKFEKILPNTWTLSWETNYKCFFSSVISPLASIWDCLNNKRAVLILFSGKPKDDATLKLGAESPRNLLHVVSSGCTPAFTITTFSIALWNGGSQKFIWILNMAIEKLPFVKFFLKRLQLSSNTSKLYLKTYTFLIFGTKSFTLLLFLYSVNLGSSKWSLNQIKILKIRYHLSYFQLRPIDCIWKCESF